MNNVYRHKITDQKKALEQLLYWANGFSYVAYLNPNQYKQGFPHLIAVSNQKAFSGTDFNSLKNGMDQYKGKLLLGHLTYDLKNDVEQQLQSLHSAQVSFPELSFFTPDHLIRIKDEYWEIESSDPSLPEKIFSTPIPSDDSSVHAIQPSITREEYIHRVEKIRGHILQGDIFEMNFCQEFKIEASVINPIETYLQLTELSPMPFSCLYKREDQYLICASPERFIQKTGSKIISQPIKGTAKRSLQPEEDLKIKTQLASSEKERAENIMIVDLVRNDLSRTCEAGTVKVDELCKVYTFRQVHQMISTISGKQRNDVHPSEVIRLSFPMGSMTGAPKVSAMKLTEKYEGFRRGIFSGAIGFITPEGDFDFNVVIRSIVYDQNTKQAALYAGSAITWASDAALEYDECLTKADTMFQVLKKTNVE